MRKTIIGAAALMVAVMLAACGTSEGVGGVDNGTAQTVSGQVADYSGSAGTLEARDVINNVNVGAGSIAVDGTFTLELTEPSPELVTNPIIYTEGCPDLRVSPRDAKGFIVTEINVVANGNPVGNIAQGNFNADAESFSFTSVTRIYADRDITVKGTCVPSGTDGENVITYDLNYKQGWNIGLAEVKSRPNTSGIFSENSTVSPGDVENITWLYAPNSN